MKPFFQQIIKEYVRKHPPKEDPYWKNKKAFEKEAADVRISILHLIKNTVLIGAGIFSAGFGLKGFLLPNHFVDGGVTGISLLTARISLWPLPVLLVVFNIPFLLLGLSQIGRAFAIKSVVAITVLALAVAFIEYPVVTFDKVLVAVFGGFFIGMGIGLAVRGGAVLDGTEILAIYLGKRTGLTIGDVILLFNILIFSVAAWLLSVEVALYSILSYLAASKTVDFIIEGIEEYLGVTIISLCSEEVRLMIIEKMGRGVTIYEGKRGYGQRGDNLKRTDIVFTVITRLEIAKLHTEMEKIDPDAFIVMGQIKDTKGGMIKKRPLVH